jgi:hypothetical protein
MYPYDQNDYPRWCLVTRPEHFRMVIDWTRDVGTLDVVVAEAALSPDGVCYRMFFRTESLVLWYRRKYDLPEYLVLETDYDNWLRLAGGGPIYVLEGITDKDLAVSLVLPE